MNKFAKKQAPITSDLLENGFTRHEVEKLWRRCADLLYEHPSLVPVRFCLPNYPREWISMESQVQPFRDFINDFFLDQPQFSKPVSIFFQDTCWC